MVSKLCLTFIFVIAGFAHLIFPQVFYPAIPFEYKFEINIIVGALELFLAAGLWPNSTQDMFARLIALWLMALIPIHIYVSWKKIAIFGVSNPIILWTRTLMQSGLIFWALSLQKKGWIISQRWSDILFIHYEVDPAKLQSIVPYPLDLYQGRAVVSIVPFKMGKIRFPFLPAIPGVSQLCELNLRTYVKIDNRPMVYFLTLDANHFFGVFVANLLFRLPYRWRKMNLTLNDQYVFKSNDLKISANINKTLVSTEFDIWATERYALVTKFLGKDLIGVVEHNPWSLKKATIENLENKFSDEFIELKHFIGASYAKDLDVRFRPFYFK